MPAAVAVVVLLAAGAVAAGATAADRGEDAQVRLPSLGVVGDAVVVLLTVAGVAVIIGALLLAGQKRRAGTGRDLPALAQIATLVAVAVLLLGLPRLRDDPEEVPDEPRAEAVGAEGEGDEAPAASTGDLALILLVLAAGVAVVVAATARGRRAAADAAAIDGDDGHGAAAALADVLDEAAIDIRAAGDPRRAVIGAYARMEAVLAGHGLPRRSAEAPLEYLDRCLHALDAGGDDVRRLTGLFQEAMFSAHPVSSAMGDAAADALLAVRDGLRVGATP